MWVSASVCVCMYVVVGRWKYIFSFTFRSTAWCMRIVCWNVLYLYLEQKNVPSLCYARCLLHWDPWEGDKHKIKKRKDEMIKCSFLLLLCVVKKQFSSQEQQRPREPNPRSIWHKRQWDSTSVNFLYTSMLLFFLLKVESGSMVRFVSRVRIPIRLGRVILHCGDGLVNVIDRK